MATKSEGDLESQLEALIARAEDLVQHCKQLAFVSGIQKLEKQCQAELKFLVKVKQKKSIKEVYMKSTNLIHLEGILQAAENLPHVVHVLQPASSPGQDIPVVVDVVCNHGFTWVKVVARKAQALHQIWAGDGQFGERCIVKQATQYAECAERSPVNFIVPKVLFIFTNGLTEPLQRALQDAGIRTAGKICHVSKPETRISAAEDLRMGLADTSDVTDSDMTSESVVSNSTSVANHTSLELRRGLTAKSPTSQNAVSVIADFTILDDIFLVTPSITRVNLDITCLLALISNLCHGRCHYTFQEDVLTYQAEQERKSPLLPKLKAFLKDKDLAVCGTALKDFRAIVNVVGGPTEKERAEELLRGVTVVEDSVSEKVDTLKLSLKVKERAKTVFGTGDMLQAVTATSNSGFVRAAANQGVNLAVFLHDPRALTEQKEATATITPPAT